MSSLAPTSEQSGEVGRNPSDSAVQRTIELVMLQRFGDRHPGWSRGVWPPIARELGLAAAWVRAEPDAVWETETGEVVIAEAYARIGVLKEGQKRKLAKDALKLLSLQNALPHVQRVRCLLLIPEDVEQQLAGGGWFPLALRGAAELVSVPLTASERSELLGASALQAQGQARTPRKSMMGSQ